ncbi:MAG: sugar phosphate isomerase/epimerase [Chloroflexi bacterium]|nr:MAG: sugar phosphate isomerase/epimerase [Chloroflexota bacterium]HDN80405.1 sugar phosphate isomerase/epimerase [Chloroflexota bacterium]
MKRYAACTWILGDSPLAEIASRLADMGYDGLELLGDLDRYQPREVKTVLDDYGLDVVSITPADVDLAHPEDKTWQQALDYYLRLLDFAAEFGHPIVGCHGTEARIRAITTYEEEYARYVTAVQRIAVAAQERELRIAIEALNRYETHFLHKADQVMRFIAEVGAPNVGILLDTYHMNIEEPDLAAAVLKAGKRLYLFHVADSNREAVGRGHIDFLNLIRALKAVEYEGPIVVECTAPGPDPFTPVKGAGWKDIVYRYLEESITLLKAYEDVTTPL